MPATDDKIKTAVRKFFDRKLVNTTTSFKPEVQVFIIFSVVEK